MSKKYYRLTTTTGTYKGELFYEHRRWWWRRASGGTSPMLPGAKREDALAHAEKLCKLSLRMSKDGHAEPYHS